MVASSVSPQLSYYDKCFLSRWGEKTRLVARHKSSFNRDNTQPIRLKMQRKHKETILAMFCIYSEAVEGKNAGPYVLTLSLPEFIITGMQPRRPPSSSHQSSINLT